MTTAADKRAARIDKDLDRAALALDGGPLHIHQICSRLRIPRKSARARDLYLAIKADQARFARAPLAPSIWMLADQA